MLNSLPGRRGGAVMCFAATWSLSTGVAVPQSSASLSFQEDIFPILEQRCLTCHGESQRQAGLDLRTREGMLQGGDNGPVLVPGDAGESRLYRRISGLEAPVMPMGGEISESEILTIRDWINQGAPIEGNRKEAAVEADPRQRVGRTEGLCV